MDAESTVPHRGLIEPRDVAESRSDAKATRTILIVDDDASIRGLLVFTLKRSGYECLEACDAAEARKCLTDGAPDLILLDWMLPGMNGLALLRLLKSQRDTHEIPVIMLSGRATEEDRVEGLESGASDYVSKPFSVRELTARVEVQLRGYVKPHCETRDVALQESEGGPITVGGLCLEPLTHRVLADGKNCAVGRTEFQMLKFFLGHPEQVYSRRQLLEQIRGPGADIDERAVDVHVRRLRFALEPFGYDGFLQTVYGIGYRFSALPDNK